MMVSEIRKWRPSHILENWLKVQGQGVRGWGRGSDGVMWLCVTLSRGMIGMHVYDDGGPVIARSRRVPAALPVRHVFRGHHRHSDVCALDSRGRNRTRHSHMRQLQLPAGGNQHRRHTHRAPRLLAIFFIPPTRGERRALQEDSR